MNGLLISLWAAPAALGFALFFNVRRRTLVPIAAIAVLAHLLRSVAQAAGWDLVTASFAAAVAVGAIAYTLGPYTGEASPVYAFAPVIPLIPGTLIFDGFRDLAALLSAEASGIVATGLLTHAGQQILTAAGVVLALAVGTTSPMLLVPRMRAEVQ